MTMPAAPVLHVGCGNSDLSIGIGEDGTPVVNTDISPVVIQQMREEAATWPPGPARSNCSWEMADCRAMPQFEDDAFGMVLDKGTLDAVLCSGTGLGDARCYVSETHRLLAPGGVFLLISLGQPETRLAALRAQPRRRRPSSADAASGAPPPLWSPAPAPTPASAAAAAATALSARLAAHFAAAAETAGASAVAAAGYAGRREVRWSRVQVYLLPKPSAYLQNEAGLIGRRLAAAAEGAPPRLAVGKDEPVVWLGPYEVGGELEAALAAPGLDPRDYFFAYACVKAGAGPGSRSRSRRASSLVARECVGGAGAAAGGAAEGGGGAAGGGGLARGASFAGDSLTGCGAGGAEVLRLG